MQGDVEGGEQFAGRLCFDCAGLVLNIHDPRLSGCWAGKSESDIEPCVLRIRLLRLGFYFRKAVVGVGGISRQCREEIQEENRRAIRYPSSRLLDRSEHRRLSPRLAIAFSKVRPLIAVV